jgi:NADH-quinone oxidoreductase subunit F
VIVAIGQSPDLALAEAAGGAAEEAGADETLVVTRSRIVADPLTQRSGQGSLFAGGDAVTGPATIAEAVAAGQRAAVAIDRHLGGKGVLPPDVGFASREAPDEAAAAAPRQRIRARAKRRRKGNFDEVLRGYSLRKACAEARRCLRCDLE